MLTIVDQHQVQELSSSDLSNVAGGTTPPSPHVWQGYFDGIKKTEAIEKKL